SGVAFSGALVAATESAKPHDYIGSWPDTPLDICVLDTSGNLWWLRTKAQQTGWQISQVAGPAKLSALLAGIVVDTATGGAATGGSATQPAVQVLQLYATSVGRSNEVSLRVPDFLPALTTDGSWASLSPVPAEAAAQSSGVAVPLGQGASVIVLPGGD